MRIENRLPIDVSRMIEKARAFDTDGLYVVFKPTRKGAKARFSGVCRFVEKRIRVSVNLDNTYPVKQRIGSPFKKAEGFVEFHDMQELAEFIFWHEMSHYLDHENGRNTRNKQTKADRFAIGIVGKKRVEM